MPQQTSKSASSTGDLKPNPSSDQADLNAVLQAVPVGITVFESVRDLTGGLTDLRLVRRNDLALALSRIPKEIYKPGALLSQLMPPELYENFERMLDVVRTQEPWVHELYQPHLDKWILSSINPHADGILSTIQDITHIKRYGQEKNRQAKMLNGVLEATPNGVAVFEAIRGADGAIKDFTVVHANEQVIRWSGCTIEEYLGKTLLERMPEQKAELPRLAKLIADGSTQEQEMYVRERDQWIHITTSPLGDGFVSSIQDITDRKRQQEEVLNTARTLEGILQASPHAILVFEALRDTSGVVFDFQIIRFNQKAVIATGQTAEFLRGTTLFTCMPSVRSRLVQYVAVMESGTPETYEFFNEKLGMWRRITNTPLGDGFVMTMEDITEQKQIARQNEESANLLNAVLDSSPMAVVVYESVRDESGFINDFRPIIINRQALTTANLSMDQFMAMTLLDRNPGRTHDLLPALRDVVVKREPQVHEHLVVSSGRWVRAITTPFGDGFIATSQDITDQKEQRRIIEEQAQLFNGVLSSLQNGLSILKVIRNEQGELDDIEYVAVADSVLKNTGLSREQTIGQRMRRLFPGIETTDYWRAYAEAAETGKPVHFESHFTLHGFDNHLLNWVTSIGPDKLVSVYYIVNDLKRVQQELEHKIHELRRSNEDLEQFASIASHDLQEPLRKVQSFGAILESRFGDLLGIDGRDLLGRMTGAATRMRNLVTGLLSFARLSGDEHTPLAAVDLHTLLYDEMQELDQSADSSGGTLDIPERIPFVLGIESQLRQLFHNLLVNALKFRKPDVQPRITIKAGPLLPGDIEKLSPLAKPTQHVRIEVRDNGIGFEPEFAEKIFGLFERLHGMNEYQGTGLGLSICRRVAERHGGTIWAEGHPGKGAAFFILLKKAS